MNLLRTVLPGSAGSALSGIATDASLLLFAAAQLLLLLYASHRWLVLFRARGRARPRPSPPDPAHWPRVTVQLPLYNERRVAERLIDAVAALDYPAQLLEIQVLDDSTDETTALAAAAVRRHAERGTRIAMLHRDTRAGYKAGALAAGLAAAHGELIAVFDADFVPDPDFLRRLVPHFGDPAVGMAQARWGHLNRDQSWLTTGQAVMLDAHFLLEHESRMREGLFFNFNGTAGIWRRAAIEGAGGWTHDTLTEDLDLSYRAQLAGWRFVFDPRVEVRAELPARAAPLRSQQRRWARGSIQTARKVLPGLLASRRPLATRLEALVHLTGNAVYPLALLLGLLQLPVVLATSRAPAPLVLGLHLATLVFGLVPVLLFLGAGSWATGRRDGRLVRDVVVALVLSAGLSLNNSIAVLQGLGPRLGEWQRTPKAGAESGTGPARYPLRRPLTAWAELALAASFIAVAAIAALAGAMSAIPFALLLAAGLGFLGAGSLAPERTAATGA